MNYNFKKTLLFVILSCSFLTVINAQTFTELDVTFKEARFGALAWGDYDMDGDLDILIAGEDTSRIYKNTLPDSIGFVVQDNLALIGASTKSVAWGDYDNDGDLDVVLTGSTFLSTGEGFVSKIYKNTLPDSIGFAEQTSISLSGIIGSVAWGDYDNDGDLDILLSGGTQIIDEKITKIYENNGDGSFTEQTGISLLGNGSLAWGDYDNDGDLDILITDDDVSRIYKNTLPDSIGFKEQTNITLTGVDDCSVAWGDYDNDDDLDILLTGETSSFYGEQISKIYKNNGDNSFSEQTGISLTGVYLSSVAWGDYDNDGFLDILLTGAPNGSGAGISKIYKNNGDGSFTGQSSISLTGVYYSSAAWGDYDNDGDMDVILTGSTGGENSFIPKVYTNNTNATIQNPQTPLGLKAEYSTKTGLSKISWNKSTDTVTTTYNLRIGTSPGGCDIMNPQSISDGTRLLPMIGNTGYDISLTINLPLNKYYIAVQAIDKNHYGSEFSDEIQYSFDSIQSSNLSIENLYNNSVILKWENGNLSRRAVFIKESATRDTAYPLNNVKYISSPVFGEGDQISNTGWYCVYNGKLDRVLLTGLTNVSYNIHVFEYLLNDDEITYCRILNDNVGSFSLDKFTEQSTIFKEPLTGSPNGTCVWGDYDNDGDLDVIISTSESLSFLYKNNGNGSFTKQTGLVFPGVKFGSVISWGDCDNDGDLDILFTGHNTDIDDGIAAIYINNGDGSFTEQTGISISGAMYGSVAWGDYNNDGFLDILLTGKNDSEGLVSKIYKNNGDGSFAEQTNIAITRVYKSSVAWGDYDNDGDLDILLSGSDTHNEWKSEIYKNNGDGSFTEQAGIWLTGCRGSVAWGDYDNDGDLDILFAGWHSRNQITITKIYKNNGNNSFTEQTNISLTGVHDGSVVWGDYDNDGDLDILLTGLNQLLTDRISKIYNNNGDGSFTEETDILITPLDESSVAWGDYDNDGDLDILLTGRTDNIGDYSSIYRNNLVQNISFSNFNKKPKSPVNLNDTVKLGEVTFSWSGPESDETPEISLTYNLAIGNHIDSLFVNAPHNFDTIRTVAGPGNVSLNNSYTMNLPGGKYYWRVQAVDGGFKGGDWSVIDSFEIKTTEAYFTFDTVCLNFPTTFTNNSIASVGIATHTWYFGDGTTSTEISPTHTFAYSGNHIVKLVIEATDGEKDSITQTVYVKYLPDANFSASTECVGTATNFINATNISNVSGVSYQWDFGDGGTSTNENPGTHGYLNAGVYTVKLVAIADNGCSDSTSNIVSVGVVPDSTILIQQGSLVFCDGGTLVLSAPFNASFTYQWLLNGAELAQEIADTILIDTTYDYLNSDTYSAIITNTIGNCSTTSKKRPVDIKNTPVSPNIITSGSTTFCKGDSVTLLVAENSDYTYQWKLNGGAIGADKHELVARSSGVYNLEVRNSNGCSSESANTVAVTVHDNPNVPSLSLTGSVEFCEGESAALSIPENKDYSYRWLNNGSIIEEAIQNSIQVNETGIYSLKVSNEEGCEVMSNTESITVNPSPTPPAITTLGATSVCQGDSVILSVTNNPDYTYQWKLNGGAVGVDSSQLIAASSGIYSLEVSNSSGCSVDAVNTIEVTVLDKPTVPTVIIGGPTTFCNGDSVILSVAKQEGISYQWKNEYGNIAGATYTTITAKESGNYYLELSNEYGCSVQTETTEVTVSPKPTAPQLYTAGSTSFCNGDSVRLTFTPIEGVSYQWYRNEAILSGANTQNYKAKITGSYTVKATNASGCIAESEGMDITVHANPETPSLSYGETTFCEGDSVVISTSNKEDLNYNWYKGNALLAGKTEAMLKALTEGNYSLIISNSNNCIAQSQQIKVSVRTAPTKPYITAIGDTVYCPGGSVSLKTDENSNLRYQWLRDKINIGTNNSQVNVELEGIYSLMVTDTNDCMTTSVNSIRVQHYSLPPAPLIDYAETAFCKGDSTILSIADEEGHTVNWYRNNVLESSKSYSIIAKTEGSYMVELINSKGCKKQSGNVNITIWDAPNQVRISPESIAICEGNAETLSVQEQDGFSYQWYINADPIEGEIYSSTEVNKTGQYHVVISNANNCNYVTNKAIVKVSNIPEQEKIIAAGNMEICLGEDVKLSVTENEYYRYQWFIDGEPIEDTSYYTLAAERGMYKVDIINKENQECRVTTKPLELKHKPSLPAPTLLAEGSSTWVLACDNPDAAIYRWYYNGDLIPGEDEYIHVAGKNLGDYYITVSDGGECHVPSNIITIPLNATGITEVETVFGEIKIYPNPTPGLFTIEMNNQIIGTLYIRIVNESGKELFNIKHNKTTKHLKTEMDLSGQGDGIYFIEFRFKEDRVVRKVVVK